jgi:hypothetical protein
MRTARENCDAKLHQPPPSGKALGASTEIVVVSGLRRAPADVVAAVPAHRRPEVGKRTGHLVQGEPFRVSAVDQT